YKGAQKEEYIAEADFSLIEDFADVIKVAVLAPETLRRQPEKIAEFMAGCAENKIIVSLGHSAADYDEAVQAIKAGASHVTHLCNAMTGLHHRLPGLVGAALDTDATCELIADDLHVHPAVQRIIYRTKGAAELELITDSMRACGLPEGISELGGQTVYVKDGEARLADGTIAGSVVTMNRAMANFRKNTGASIPEVVRMVTENQAQELGLFEKIGSLCPGAAADITIFNEDFTVLYTFVDGCEVYKNSDFR
ncbi:MAG: amidohydrolase family protein, partial [Acidaminococcaceae bacterium]|nr:amidohydrolase family protein [Acidaminococcaceae bacterium]